MKPTPFNVDLYQQLVGQQAEEERPNHGRRGRPQRRRRELEDEREDWEADSFEEELAEMRIRQQRDLEIARQGRAERLEKRRLQDLEDSESSEALKRPKRLKYKGSPPKQKVRRMRGFTSNPHLYQGRTEDQDKENFIPIISREDIMAHAIPQNVFSGANKKPLFNDNDLDLENTFRNNFNYRRRLSDDDEDQDSDVVKQRRKWQKKKEKFRNRNIGVVQKGVFLSNLMASGDEEPRPEILNNQRSDTKHGVKASMVQRKKIRLQKSKVNKNVVLNKKKIGDVFDEGKNSAAEGKRRGKPAKKLSRLEEIELIEEQKKRRLRKEPELTTQEELEREAMEGETIDCGKKENRQRGKLRKIIDDEAALEWRATVKGLEVTEEEPSQAMRRAKRQRAGPSRMEQLEALDALGKRRRKSGDINY